MRPPPGRTAPQVLLSLPALQLSRESNELLAPLLTESVQEARSAVSVGDGQRACIVSHYRQVKKEMDDIGSAGLGVLNAVSCNNLDWRSCVWPR